MFNTLPNISKANKEKLHMMIKSNGFDSIFDEGEINDILIEPDYYLQRLVDDYQIATRKLLNYIER
jgi:hypothetical protein